jgi:hypothetical protein
VNGKFGFLGNQTYGELLHVLGTDIDSHEGYEFNNIFSIAKWMRRNEASD